MHNIIINDIIYAIAQGATKLNEIAIKTGIQSGGLTYYINSLMELGIISKNVPAGSKNYKRLIYSISDYVFRFFFKFLQTYLTA